PDVLEAQKIDRRSFENICSRIASWLDTAENPERVLALEALQVNVTATRESVTVRGILPLEGPEFITDDRTSPCSSTGELASAYSARLPFGCESVLRAI
ncbi:MAG: hypothetical protein V3T78_01305, partial [Dehalococcoidia bacterium]